MVYEAPRSTAFWRIYCCRCVSSHSLCFGLSNPHFCFALAMGRTRVDLRHHITGDSKFRMEIPCTSCSCCLFRWWNQCNSLDHDRARPNTLHNRRTYGSSNTTKRCCSADQPLCRFVRRCLVVVGDNDRNTKSLRCKSTVLFRDSGISVLYQHVYRSHPRHGLLAQLRHRTRRGRYL